MRYLIIISAVVAVAIAAIQWSFFESKDALPTAGPMTPQMAAPASQPDLRQIAGSTQVVRRSERTDAKRVEAVGKTAEPTTKEAALELKVDDTTRWTTSDVFAKTRTAPAQVEVAAIESSARLNPASAEFSAELRETLGSLLEQLRVTHARLAPDIARIEAQEFAKASKSSFATRKPVSVTKDELGNEIIEVQIGLYGEESEVVFGEAGAEVVRVPTRLMSETNSLRILWLCEWVEFWHNTLLQIERAGHLENTQSDAIARSVYAELEGIAAGYQVPFDALLAARKKR